MDNERFHEINIHKLEEEWVDQVRMYRYHADQLVEAEYAQDMAETELHIRKEELKEEFARIDLSVRRSPEAYDFPPNYKPTEKAIEHTVLIHPDYKKARDAVHEAMRKLNEAKKNRNTCAVAEKTVGNQRKPALQDLVQLEGRAYYARPSLPADSGGRQMNKAKADAAFGRRAPPS